MQKLQVRSISDYETLLSKRDFDSFRISSINNIAVEIYKILNGMGPEYLSTPFSKSNAPYPLRGDDKLIQPLKRTTTFGIKSLAYFKTHLWNMLPRHIKKSVSLRDFKSMIGKCNLQRGEWGKWSGPTCLCCVCTLVLGCHSLLVCYYRFIAHCPFNVFTESIYSISLLPIAFKQV